jgi:TolB protein
LTSALTDLTRRRLLAAWSLAAVAGPAAAQFRVEITGVGATQVPLVLGPFRDEGQSGVAVSQIVRADLERSGQFSAVSPDTALDERSTIDMAQWRGRGADALVAGSVSRLADGRFDVRYKLWDTVKGDELLGQSKLVLAGDLRLAAHRVADEIHQKLTGERGVYATRIAYVVRAGRRYTLHVTDADGEGGQVALASFEPIISLTCPSKRRRRWSGCKTSAPASGAWWRPFAAATAPRPGRPTASGWR